MCLFSRSRQEIHVKDRSDLSDSKGLNTGQVGKEEVRNQGSEQELNGT